MAEELGKIEKLPVDSFKKGRKLFFVPLIFGNPETPEEYIEKFNRYWEQVAGQINELEAKLGAINHVYHELVAETGAHPTHPGAESLVSTLAPALDRYSKSMKDRIKKEDSNGKTVSSAA